MPRPLAALIDITALRHNLAVAKSHSPNSKILAVIKANAYGHGLASGLRAFSAADGLGLVEMDGAVRLREMGWKKTLVLLEGFFDEGDLHAGAEHQLDFSVHCIEQVRLLEKTKLAGAVDIHLQMNSGMNRLGFDPLAYAAAYARLRAIPAVRRIILMTHFANADGMPAPHLPVTEQVRRFSAGILGLEGETSLSNSGAILLHPELASDWVRPGIMLYGGTPGGKTAQEFGLLPGMTLSSEIIGIQELSVGEAVGYGSRFVARQPTRIGVVACGYADGYPRHAPDGTPVLVDGIRTQLIGRVSMDMLTVDLTAMPDAQIGSVVTLWGNGLPIDDVAKASGTIGYELMCAVAPRVPMTEFDV